MKLGSVLCIGMLLVVSFNSFAYGEQGHRMICQLALNNASAATQTAVAAVVAGQAEYSDFAQLCVWPDDIKSEASWDWAKPHHYVNFPRSAEQVSPSDCADKGCVLFAIAHHRTVLQHNPDNWQSLAFLGHFIGDLHQPMHVSYADDLGGNRAEVRFYNEPTNLHAVWDYGLLEQLLAQRELDYQSYMNQLQRQVTLVATGKPQTVIEWANESAAITRQIYRLYESEAAYGDAYLQRFEAVWQQRVILAAMRLADTLDAIYAPD